MMNKAVKNDISFVNYLQISTFSDTRSLKGIKTGTVVLKSNENLL